MSFVVRIRGYHNDARGEVGCACWLTERGTASSVRSHAQFFETEDEAWFYMALSGEMGDDENGEWCWVEDAALSEGQREAPVLLVNNKKVEPGQPYEVPYRRDEDDTP